MDNWLSALPSADLAAGISLDRNAAVIFFIVGLVIVVGGTIAAGVSTVLGALRDGFIGWVIMAAGLALLVWGLASHNYLLAGIGSIAAVVGLIGILFYLSDVGGRASMHDWLLCSTSASPRPRGKLFDRAGGWS